MARQATANCLETYTGPLSDMTRRHSIPCPLNQATALARKPITVGFCSSAVGEARGVIYCDVDLVVADPIGPPFLPVAGDPVAYLPEAGQGLDIDVDQVARSLPLVALHRRSGLQVAESPQAQPAEGSGNGGEGSRQQPGDVAQMQPLVTEIHGLLQLLRIERPALVVPNTPPIRKCRWTACVEACQPLVSAAEADPSVSSESRQ